MQAEQLYEYRVWKLPTRLFHRINLTAVITGKKHLRGESSDADAA